jgi:hypothetical protein
MSLSDQLFGAGGCDRRRRAPTAATAVLAADAADAALARSTVVDVGYDASAVRVRARARGARAGGISGVLVPPGQRALCRLSEAVGVRRGR